MFLAACDSDQNSSDNTTVFPQSTSGNATNIAFAMPERIRTSQVANPDATIAIITTSAGDITLNRNGDQFEGNIMVEPGSSFSYTLSISENNIVYATISGETDGPVNTDIDIELTASEFVFPDDDGDGADNLSEVEAGSDPTNSFSTPTNPDGVPPADTNPGQLQFASSTFSVAEADGQLVIPVTRTGGSDGRVTVLYTTNNETALIGRDFNAASGQLVWEDGDNTPQTFTVTILSDDINDGEQTFSANLSSPVGGAGIGNGSTQITIIDSTPPPQRGTIQLVSGQVSVNEDAGEVEVIVERTGGTDGPVTVDYVTITGSATADDFTQVLTAQTLEWADGEEGTRTIVIPITNDTEVENTETFTINLFNALGGASLGLSEVSVAIIDTSPAPVTGQLSFASSSFAIAEGSSDQIVVERVGGSDGDATVDYIVTPGTADTDDFSVPNDTLIWDDGDDSPRFIDIDTIADDELEDAETFQVTLQNAEGVSVGNGSITITINDTTEAAPGVIAFASTASSVAEGDSIEIAVQRSGGSNGEINVDVSAAVSTAFTITPDQLVWQDGDTEDQIITLTAIADNIIDDTETIEISLSNATGGATISGATTDVTINDTTEPPEPEPEIPGPEFFSATDGEWEACVAPFNTPGPSAFATQQSANEGRTVDCIKTCDLGDFITDEEFPGYGFNPVGQFSCTTARVAEGTLTTAPVYTPERISMNLNLSTELFAVEDAVWGCTVESRVNALDEYEADSSTTLWYQFMDDGTYLFDSTDDGVQPDELLGTDVWSVDGRVLELGHLNIGYRNTLFLDNNQTLHIHVTAEERINCSQEASVASLLAQ